MGGVDRSDQNISLYRISLRGKKWYFPLIYVRPKCMAVAQEGGRELRPAELQEKDCHPNTYPKQEGIHFPTRSFK